MRQWQFGPQPGLEHLTLNEAVQRPTLNPYDVRVQVRAVSLNYRDLILLSTADRYVPGRVPCSDGAGEVIEVGSSVTRWKVGDRVVASFFRDWLDGPFEMRHHQAALGGSVDGVLQDEFVSPEHGLARMPKHFSFAEGATLPCAGLTAWYSLMDRGHFMPGDSVLLQGTGGVSIWGLQIVKAAGGSAIVTSSSDMKLARAQTLGADAVINYRNMIEWDKEVLRLTNKRGVDHILEVGGPQTLGRSIACIAAGGHLAQIGVLTGFEPAPVSLFPLVAKNARLSGIYVVIARP